MGKMLKKHFPTKHKHAEEGFIPHKGSELIFHGGCLGCLSQRLHGVDRCKGCQYFKANWDLPNLKIDGEDCDMLTQDDINNLLK